MSTQKPTPSDQLRAADSVPPDELRAADSVPPDELRAADLLPPDGPAPVDPSAVRPADDTLEPQVEQRKIGIRRVRALAFADRFTRRANRRPAGNSRAFWSKIEADDPFMKAPARPTDAPLEIYPAQRIDRTSGSLPKPQPDVARAYPPPAAARSAEPQAAAPRPPPRPQPPPPRREPPEVRHTPEPRPAPRPPPPRPEPEPEVAAPRPPADQVVPAPSRRLPPRPGGNPKATSGRIAAGGSRQRMPSRAPEDRPSAAEIREQKLRAREQGTGEAPPAKKHNLDTYRNFVQMMEVQQAAHERGDEIPTAFADTADAPRPKPKAVVQRPKADDPPAAPRPAPVDRTPPRPSPPVDRTPPRPSPKADAAPPGRPAPPGGGDLNDLFGGPNEGRVRIGKRTAKKDPEGGA